jgi:thiamine-phosphate pyrophosphorylase
MLQVREPGLADADVVDLGRRMREAVEEFGAMVLVNERFDLSLAAGAAGVHLKASGLPTEVVRSRLGPGPVIARSTHTPDEARRAGDEGADFVVFGPVFATPSKAAFGPPAGLERLEETCRVAGIPVLAIGGVTPGNAAACTGAGAAGVAVIRAVVAAEDPGEAVRDLRTAAREATTDVNPEGETRG